MGKPDTFSLGEDGQGHFYGHPRRSVELAEGILTRLRFPRRTREQVLCLVRYHDAVIEESPQRVRRWLNKLGPERFFDLLEIQRGCLRPGPGILHKVGPPPAPGKDCRGGPG
ncbi:MAG: hypothetical protein ACLR1T_03265 [Evtepia gabavorous]